MRWFTDFRYRLRALFNPKAMERELDEELKFHLDMETRKYVERGMGADEARRQALQVFGPVARQKQHSRDAWGISLARDAQSDVSFAGRQLRRNPAFALLAALTLGLGIGGTVALWGVVDGLLLRPLPFADEDRLVVFWSGGDWMGMEYDFARQQVRAYDGLAAFTSGSTSMQNDTSTSILPIGQASDALFEILRAQPLMGRTFDATDDLPQAEPVVVLSHGLWRQELGGDADVIGRRLTIGGQPTTVIGVMPPEFYFPYPEVRAWLPLKLDPLSDDYFGNGYLEILGRVRRDVTEQQLEADVATLAAALGERFDYPEPWDKSKGAHVTPLRELLLGDVQPALLLLLGAVGFLLLMACTNVAALLAARTADRGSEMAIRAAMGAGRGRLSRQLITESITLGLMAGAAGWALATGLFEVLVASLPLQNGFGSTLALDAKNFAAAFVLALITASLIALAPIQALLRGRLEGHLRDERRQSAGGQGGRRLQRLLVFAEVLLAVTLVIGATLLIRTVAHLRGLDPGFEAEGVLAVDLVIGPQDMDDDQRRLFFDQVVDRIAAAPGVSSAALINRLPIRGDGIQGSIAVEDRPDLEDAVNSFYRTVTPDYFHTMGIEIRRGRAFHASDRTDSHQVAIVSQGLADKIWPGQDPLGKRLSTQVGSDGQLATVVGVAQEVRVTHMTGANPLVLYRPQSQQRYTGTSKSLVLRTELPPESLIPVLRDTVRQTNSRVALAGISTLDEIVSTALAEPLRLRFFLMLFASIGLVLGSVGIYGVVSYAVTRRRSELGIRMALGAEPSKVLWEVISGAMVPVVFGILGGATLSLALTRLLRGFLFEIEPTDPASFAMAAGVLLTAGIIAAWIPALRAGRLDPSEALRAE